MALAAEALTTLAKAELYLDRTGGTGESEVEDDDFLELLINSYSVACARYCSRQFTPERDGPNQGDDLLEDVVKTFAYDGSGFLSLAPYEAREITAVKLYTDLATVDQVTLLEQSGTQESEYRKEPRQRTGLGTYLWLAVPTFDLAWASRGNRREVSVTGSWGAEAGRVPPDVELACLIAVANAYRNPADMAAAAVGGMDMTEFPEDTQQSLPRASRALLTPYRRP